MSTIYLTGPRKDQTVVLSKRFQFIDGAMEVDDKDLSKVFHYLKKFYPVSMTEPGSKETVKEPDAPKDAEAVAEVNSKPQIVPNKTGK